MIGRYVLSRSELHRLASHRFAFFARGYHLDNVPWLLPILQWQVGSDVS